VRATRLHSHWYDVCRRRHACCTMGLASGNAAFNELVDDVVDQLVVSVDVLQVKARQVDGAIDSLQQNVLSSSLDQAKAIQIVDSSLRITG
jgi:hypothetical protein